MIFADMQDSHDKRIEKLMEKKEATDAEVTNFNLVGMRRRLNNIEIGVWVIAVLLAVDLFKRW